MRDFRGARLSLALRYGTRVVLLDRGRVTADGPAADVLASEALRRAYGMDVAAWMAQTAEQWREVANRPRGSRRAVRVKEERFFYNRTGMASQAASRCRKRFFVIFTPAAKI